MFKIKTADPFDGLVKYEAILGIYKIYLIKYLIFEIVFNAHRAAVLDKRNYVVSQL